jgi:hypothetical protein
VKRGRWLSAVIVILAAAYTAWSIFWVLVGWMVCCWLIRMDFVTAASIVAVLNLLGLFAFAKRGRSWGTPALIGVQVGNILFALAASVAVSPAWLLTDAAPALVILVLVLLFQRSQATSRRQPEV